MTLTGISIANASGSEALDALIARCEGAAMRGKDAESRAYLSGIFEVLASGQESRDSMRLSA